ncbi:MAG TPA: MotA/TolQ/ExbB proton channel family protein [Phycisphaerae bacterium]|nr:MotA/TolQ/ExbB proton channel family protein [Phycisphaerae bacterium]
MAILCGVVLCLSAAALAQGEAPKETRIDYFHWFVAGGGAIGWLLILINFASWALIIEHFVTIRRANILPMPVQGQIDQMVEAGNFREVIEFTGAEPSMLSHMVHQSLTEAAHGYPAMERAMEEAGEERTGKLLRKIELLNVIGNVAPMLGLLGTVYGMILAFSKIVAEGDMPKPGVLAEGIGIALVTTFWGLVVAIPALAVYALIRNRIDGVSGEAMVAAQGVIATFRPGRKRKTGERNGATDGK